MVDFYIVFRLLSVHVLNLRHTLLLRHYIYLAGLHCFAFSPCRFGRYAGDFQHYFKGVTVLVATEH